MQLTKEYFDSALTKLKTEVKTEIKTEIKAEITEELLPQFDKLHKKIVSEVREGYDQLRVEFREGFYQLRVEFREGYGQLRSELIEYIREVTDEVLLAVGTDLGEHNKEVVTLGDRTDRLEVRMTVIEKAIARSNV